MSWQASILRFVHEGSPGGTIAFAVVVNVLMFAGSIAVGAVLVRRFSHRRCSEPPAPLTGTEIALSMSCVALNALVMVAGVWLFQRDAIAVYPATAWWRVVLDVAVFFFVMDVLMYVLHRVAHIPWIYPWVHRTHHRYENPRPLSLFVLNPFEVLSFGGLWLILLMIYPSSLLGIVIYLAINLTFGMIGHLGVESFPRWWHKPFTGWISTSTFHAGHHADPEHNFGFYTLIWDRLLRTLDNRRGPDSDSPPGVIR